MCLSFFAVAVLGLAACGGSSDEAATANTIARLDAPNFVTLPPVTVAPTTAPPPTTVPTEEGRSGAAQTYTVQSGDGLSKIANAFDVSLDELVEFNGWENASQLIKPGDVIDIPPNARSSDSLGSSSDDAEADSDSDEVTSGDGCSHTIVSGENPSKVAKKYDISLDDLIAANQASGVLDSFLIGDKLVIPAGGNC